MFGRATPLALVLSLLAAAHAAAQPLPARNARLGALEALSDAFEDLAAAVRPAVVQVLVTGYGPIQPQGQTTAALLSRQRGGGSGLVVGADGYIVTNAHVVEGATRVQVVLPAPRGEPSGRSAVPLRGQTVGARIVGADPETDLALLKVDATGLPALVFADSDDLKPGQVVFAFGSPLGLEDTVTMGIVSATGRQREPDDPMVFVQTDAPINPGSSGGPLVDATGRVVGVNTFIVSQSGGNEGVGFAVPSNIVSAVVDQLRTTGRVRRGTIGVNAQTVTPLVAAGLGLPEGARVVLGDVFPGGPAGGAGLRPGDVILALDGKPMENGRQLDVNVYRRPIGGTVRLSAQRGDSRFEAIVPVAERDDDPGRFTDLVNPERNLVQRLGILGLDVDDRTGPLAGRLRGPRGVLVAARAADAPRAEQGLRPGDVIYSVNGRAVGGVDALRAALDAIGRGGPCVLHVQRGLALYFVAVELD